MRKLRCEGMCRGRQIFINNKRYNPFLSERFINSAPIYDTFIKIYDIYFEFDFFSRFENDRRLQLLRGQLS
jgi:hypothetical protein